MNDMQFDNLRYGDSCDDSQGGNVNLIVLVKVTFHGW